MIPGLHLYADQPQPLSTTTETFSNNASCGICQRSPPKYTCPNCHIRYCSSTCYRHAKHVQCTEKFYEMCVRGEIKLRNQETKPRPLASQFQSPFTDAKISNENELEDESDDEWIEELSTLDLDDVSMEELWSKLPRREQHKFLQHIQQSDIVSLWTPWWEHQGSEIELDNDSDNRTPLPEITLPQETIRMRPPTKLHQNLVFNLAEVIMVYVYTWRRFNNDFKSLDEKKEALLLVTELSPVLGSSEPIVYASIPDALESTLAKILASENLLFKPVPTKCNTKNEKPSILNVFKTTDMLPIDRLKTLLLEDAACIFRNTDFLLAALSDMFHCVAAMKQDRKWILLQKKLDLYAWIIVKQLASQKTHPLLVKNTLLGRFQEAIKTFCDSIFKLAELASEEVSTTKKTLIQELSPSELASFIFSPSDETLLHFLIMLELLFAAPFQMVGLVQSYVLTPVLNLAWYLLSQIDSATALKLAASFFIAFVSLIWLGLFYVRRSYVPHKFGIKYSQRGLVSFKNVQNFDLPDNASTFLSTPEMSDMIRKYAKRIKFLFHVGAVELQFAKWYEIQAEATTMKQFAWFRLVLRNVQVVAPLQNDNVRSDRRVSSKQQLKQTLHKLPEMIRQILEKAGWITPRLSLQYILTLPFWTIGRLLLTKLLTSVIHFDLEGVDVIFVPSNDIAPMVRVQCRNIAIDASCQNQPVKKPEASPPVSESLVSLISHFLLYPKRVFIQTFLMNPSDLVLKFDVIFGSIHAAFSTEYAFNPDAAPSQKSQRSLSFASTAAPSQLSIQFRVSKFSRHIYQPRLNIHVQHIEFNSNNLIKIKSALKKPVDEEELPQSVSEAEILQNASEILETLLSNILSVDWLVEVKFTGLQVTHTFQPPSTSVTPAPALLKRRSSIRPSSLRRASSAGSGQIQSTVSSAQSSPETSKFMVVPIQKTSSVEVIQVIIYPSTRMTEEKPLRTESQVNLVQEQKLPSYGVELELDIAGLRAACDVSTPMDFILKRQERKSSLVPKEMAVKSARVHATWSHFSGNSSIGAKDSLGLRVELGEVSGSTDLLTLQRIKALVEELKSQPVQKTSSKPSNTTAEEFGEFLESVLSRFSVAIEVSLLAVDLRVFIPGQNINTTTSNYSTDYLTTEVPPSGENSYMSRSSVHTSAPSSLNNSPMQSFISDTMSQVSDDFDSSSPKYVVAALSWRNLSIYCGWDQNQLPPSSPVISPSVIIESPSSPSIQKPFFNKKNKMAIQNGLYYLSLQLTLQELNMTLGWVVEPSSRDVHIFSSLLDVQNAVPFLFLNELSCVVSATAGINWVSKILVNEVVENELPVDDLVWINASNSVNTFKLLAHHFSGFGLDCIGSITDYFNKLQLFSERPKDTLRKVSAKLWDTFKEEKSVKVLFLDELKQRVMNSAINVTVTIDIRDVSAAIGLQMHRSRAVQFSIGSINGQYQRLFETFHSMNDISSAADDGPVELECVVRQVELRALDKWSDDLSGTDIIVINSVDIQGAHEFEENIAEEILFVHTHVHGMKASVNVLHVLYLIRMGEFVKFAIERLKTLKTASNQTQQVTSDSSLEARSKKLVGAQLLFEEVVVNFDLGDDVKLSAKFLKSDIEVKTDKAVHLVIPSIQLLENSNQPLINIDFLNVLIAAKDPSSVAICGDITADVTNFTWSIPYGYSYSQLIEKFSLFLKAVKKINGKEPKIAADGSLIPSMNALAEKDYQNLPNIALKVARAQIEVEDDPLDGDLARIFHLGRIEQNLRLARYDAFHRKVAALAHSTESQSILLSAEKAWDILQEIQSQFWLDKCRNELLDFETVERREKRPFLMRVDIDNVLAKLSRPTLIGQNLSETIHHIDNSTPTNILHDVLFAFDLDANLEKADVRLRNYAAPLLYIPPSETKLNGIVIISEHVRQFVKASTTSELSIYSSNKSELLEKLTIIRAVCPTKIYSNMTVRLPSGNEQNSAVAQFTYGMAFEPVLADVNRIFGNLTPPSADPSPPLPFWDKIRLLMHGIIRIEIPAGGAFKIRLSGSRCPDEPAVGSSAGLDIVLKSGVNVRVGREDQANETLPSIFIECGEVVGLIPADSDPAAETSLSPGVVSDSSDAESADVVIARLSGGVRVGLDFAFETKKKGSHVDVVMQSMEYVESRQLENYDSFTVLRSNSITMNVNLEAPNPSNSDQVGNTYVQLSHAIIRHLIHFGEVYTSPLTVLGIRRGTYFFPPPSKAPKPQKLSRFIKGINLNINLGRFLAGFVNGSDVMEVGARAQMKLMQLQMSLQQQNFIPGQKGAGWDILTADFNLDEMAVRMVTVGDLDGQENQATNDHDVDTEKRLSMEEDLDIVKSANWKMDLGNGGENPLGEEKFVDFFWTPRMIYFRQNESNAVDDADDALIPLHQKDVNLMHVSLLQKRIDEIDISIQKDKDTIKYWEDRIAIFSDEVLQKQSKALVEKMEALYEKRAILEYHINVRKQRVAAASGTSNTAIRPVHPTARHQRMQSTATVLLDRKKTNDFLHRFIVHHLKVIWNTELRNALFKLIELEQQAVATTYFTSNAAIRVLRSMIKSAKEQQTRQASMRDNLKDDRLDDSIGLEIAEELLSQLVADKKEHYVVNDDLEDNEDAPNVLDPSQPNYVSPEYSIVNDIMVQFFYPQVCIQTSPNSLRDAIIVVSAESMQLKNSSIMDLTIESKDTSPGQLVKTRNIFRVENAQFFVNYKMDVYKVLHSRGVVQTITDVVWPVWVPVECLIDTHAGLEEFSRLVERATLVIHYDKCNTVYLKSDEDKSSSIFASKPEGITESNSDLEHVDSLFVEIPTIVIKAKSDDYCVVLDIIQNVFVYNDPTRKQRLEQIETIRFALIKEDLTKVVDMVSELQNRVRSLRHILKGRHFLPEDQGNIEYNLMKAQNDLQMVMEALKTVVYQRQNKNSLKKSWRTVVNAKELSWLCLQDSGVPMCDLTLTRLGFYALTYEDLSHLNTIEIDKIILTNRLPRPYYRDLISPYISGSKKVDFSRHQMLRVYWHELAPVAGISIIDHFEVNIFPLMFQLTYDVRKGLFEYLYPKKSAKQKESSESSQNVASRTHSRQGKGSVIQDKSRPVSARSSVSINEVAFMQRTFSRASSNSSIGSVHDISDEASSSLLIDVSDRQEKSKKRHKKMLRRFMGNGGSSMELAPFEEFALSEGSDAKFMKDRASANKTFVYIKIPGAEHCFSYHGEKEKNIEDFYQLEFKLPSLEYHNKTWTWLEFLMQMRKDILLAIFSQSGSLVRDTFFRRRKRPPKEERVLVDDDGNDSIEEEENIISHKT